MTAMVLRSFLSGSALLSFLRSTRDSRAAARASSRCAAESFTSKGMLVYLTISGGSNMPRRKRAAKRRLTAVSISASEMSPCLTAGMSARYS